MPRASATPPPALPKPPVVAPFGGSVRSAGSLGKNMDSFSENPTTENSSFAFRLQSRAEINPFGTNFAATSSIYTQ